MLLALLFTLLPAPADFAPGPPSVPVDPYSFEFEQSPPRLSEYLRERNQRAAHERQEQFRVRVAIPDAVRDEVAAEYAARQAVRFQPPPAPAEISRETRLFGALIFLTGFLVVLKLGPTWLAAINERVNPWKLTPATAAGLSAHIRAEDQALTQFLVAFQAGPPPAPSVLVEATGEVAAAAASAPAADPVQTFYSTAARILATQRRLLEEIVGAASPAEQHEKVQALYAEMGRLRGAAGLPELLTIWQLASAVEGLLQQMANQLVNVTGSTLRTVAGGVALLDDLCVPGTPSNLLAARPLKFLAVDDDLISRNALATALKRAFAPPDVADNAPAALALLVKQTYDVIFLDVQMPGMDGFELCTRIHQTDANQTTPVVFVTFQSDFQSRAESARHGGADLIGKPFLTFEIVVKALTLAVRGRLRATESGAVAAETPPAAATDSAALTQAFTSTTSAGAAAAEPDDAIADLMSGAGLNTRFLTRASAHLEPLGALFPRIFKATDEAVRQQLLADVFLHFHGFVPTAKLGVTHPAAPLSQALEGLLRKLLADPENSTPSALVTLANGVELLNELCAPELKSNPQLTPPARMLVVDDDPLALRAIGCALQTAFERPDGVDSGELAVAQAEAQAYDIIFMDVQMPGLNGFDACRKIHETELNRATPVIFVTGHSGFKARKRALACGGADLIAKPFLTAELTVKTLTIGLKQRLQWLNAPSSRTAGAPAESSSATPQLAPTAVKPDELPDRS